MQERYPSAKQLALPLLELIEKGKTQPQTTYNLLADSFDLTEVQREKTVLGNVSYWKRRVRWVYQDLKKSGYIERNMKSLWNLTEAGKNHLMNAKAGVVVTVFSTLKGTSIWGDCREGLATIEDSCVQLCLTSPPYQLASPREYGNLKGTDYHQWLVDSLQEVKRVLTEDGSLVLNLGNVWEPGKPCMSLYQEEVILDLCKKHGFNLAQKLYWHNTTKLPTPTMWVAKQRKRLKDALESLWWLSKTPDPYSDTRAILKPYAANQLSLMDSPPQETVKRPSGFSISPSFYLDNGGAIPHNVISVPHNNCDNDYIKACKQQSLKPHPARFPWKIPEFLIKFLTKPNDVVLDIFAGSNTTGWVAEKLGRQWVSIEKSFHYIKTSLTRFNMVQINPVFLSFQAK